MIVLAFRHAPLEGIGTIGDVLGRHGIEVRIVDAAGAPAKEYGGLILMGGPMSANDDLPWIPGELAAIRDAAARGIPVLGICLGAQLIARALGARVYRNPAKEIGWSKVEWTEAARTDALFHGFSGPANVFQWHGDTFDLPGDAVHLAYSEACRHQAYRVGRNIYGIQFHPEVTAGIITEWLRQDECCGAEREVTSPIDPGAYAADVAKMGDVIFDRWRRLLN